MNITDVKVFKTKGTSKIKAMASITLDGTLVVKGFKVIEGSKGAFVGFPSEKGSDGEFKDTVFCLNKEGREEIQKAILGKYSPNDDMPF